MSGMREDFENAIAKLDEPETETPETEEVEASSEESTPPEVEAQAQEPETEGEQPESDEPAAEAAPEPDEADTAPVSWTPAAREEWANLPSAVKELVHKRENEIQRALEDGKEYRKMGEGLNSVASTYADVLQAEGVQDPVSGVENMLQVIRVMHNGSQQQKAQIMANFVNNYGVDVRALDMVLSQTAAAVTPPPEDPQPQQTPQLDPQQIAAQAAYLAQQQLTEQQTNTAATQEVATFGQGKEFFNDVRNDMADLIEMYAARGENLSLQDAYDRACAINPEVSAVIRSRSVANKRRAASSVTGRPANQGNDPAPATLRGALEAAFSGE